VSVAEAHTFVSDAINVGCGDFRRAMTSEIALAEITGHDENGV
jgi:hypothetical protein